MDEQILVGRHQLYDITNTRPPIPEPPVVENVEKVEGETDDKAPEAIQNVEEESLESVDTYKYKEGAVVDKKPNLIVELQVMYRHMKRYFHSIKYLIICHNFMNSVMQPLPYKDF